MARLADIEAHLASMGELSQVVSAMRSLAATRVRQAQEALAGIRRYEGVVGAAIARAAALAPAGDGGAPPAPEGGGRVVLLLGSEHGFVGAFNERLVESLGQTEGLALHVVGARCALVASEHGYEVVRRSAMASHPVGVLEVARGLAADLYRRIEAGDVRAVDVVYTRSVRGGSSIIERAALFPLDLAPFAPAVPPPAPLHHLPSRQLIERLVAELVLAELTRAAMESLASENAARLRAMEAAKDNVEHKLEGLRRTERVLRQEAITSELLEVVAGAQALLEG